MSAIAVIGGLGVTYTLMQLFSDLVRAFWTNCIRLWITRSYIFIHIIEAGYIDIKTRPSVDRSICLLIYIHIYSISVGCY